MNEATATLPAMEGSKQSREIGILLAALVLFAVGSLLGLWLRGPEDFALFWPSNGMLAGLLLISPRRRWGALFVLNFFSSFAAHLVFHFSIYQSTALSLANLLEVGLLILPFRKLQTEQVHLEQPRQLLPFFGMSVLAPAISGALVIAVSAHILPHIDNIQFFWAWWIGDSLGLLLMVPMVLMSTHHESIHYFRTRQLPVTLLTLALSATPNLLLNSPERIPFMFLDFPLLVWVAFRLGLFGAVLSAVLMDLPIARFAMDSSGMFGLNAFHGKETRILILQAYLLIQLAMVYLIAKALKQQRQLSEELRRSEERYRNLAENTWDMILQMDACGRCTYISPSVRDALGRSTEEIIGELAYIYVHPEDRPRADAMMIALKNGAERDLIQIRMEHQDGDYRWMELKARAVRDVDTTEMKEVVAIARDVTARVMRDMELTAAVERAESLAVTDELTGLGNRRGFEGMLETLWSTSAQKHAKMAVLMIDADNFKLFNDRHGHLAGDDCLRRLSQLIHQCVRQPTDYAARYGGEEFAVILPNSTSENAEAIAERIRFSIASSQMLRDGQQTAPITVSIGLSCQVAAFDRSPHELIRAADAALYDAKRAGRNCIRIRN